MAMMRSVMVWSLQGTVAIIAGMCWYLVVGEAMAQNISVQKGQSLYTRLCAACHGRVPHEEVRALFDPPPPGLSRPETQMKTDEELLDTIRKGHPGTAMGKWEYALSEAEMQSVLDYIRQLGQEE
jgi:mono/diheme cytochrome c family protein